MENQAWLAASLGKSVRTNRVVEKTVIIFGQNYIRGGNSLRNLVNEDGMN